MNIDPLIAAEAAAGISETVFSGPEEYNKLYGMLGEKIGGFTGIWNLIAQCGTHLAFLESEQEDLWQRYEFIEACSEIGSSILSLQEPPSDIPGLVKESFSRLLPWTPQ